jgi:hypothetical protein
MFHICAAVLVAGVRIMHAQFGGCAQKYLTSPDGPGGKPKMLL